ncbi:hypothetical protein GIW81_06175 [Hyphomicrobium sp. xq]|uniref:Trypsin-like peptidase domain-containing protein n=1 Tax=Hyphomicrobium album TaxID=2665159 RepID=A0A6I3KMI5_9HYPH|nr:hypothetical protein [Hyphomicrobium album]MTD93921.1 hypothetical protein [Hyphomicrobium album]
MQQLDEATAIKLLDELSRQLALYSVGFLAFFKAPDGLDGKPMGTGTLVSINGAKGILTAAHVVDAVSQEEVGIVRIGLGPHHLQRFKLDLKLATPHVRSTDHQKPETPEDRAPDIGFLQLPLPDAATLAASHSFYNLDIARPDALMAHELPDSGIGEAAFGVVAQWTEDLSPPGTDTRRKGVNALICQGATSNWRDIEGYDIGDFTLDQSRRGAALTDYGGMSGGPIWRFSPNSLNTEFEKALAGVIYWQADKDTSQHRITYHGPQSIQKLADFVRARV